MALPSIAQMKNRMQWKHRSLLQEFGQNEKVSCVRLNAYPTERRTLLRWECIEMLAEKDAQYDVRLCRLTERGAALRAAA